jgi:hypothetical protein
LIVRPSGAIYNRRKAAISNSGFRFQTKLNGKMTKLRDIHRARDCSGTW